MAEQWPLPAFYFTVVIDNNTDDSAFQEVSGIESQIETEEYREGGNNLVYYLPKAIKHSNLSLKRGIAGADSALVKWCQGIMESQLSKPVQPKTVSVRLLNEKGAPCCVWVFYNAYPIKWKVDGFQATKNEVAIEEVELCYSRARRAK
ncbi:T4-like virus tail tube protein gp19 [Vibrio aerogenes CECT 7868]|uniref:T4-like virus tail tube protein gp19 n=1 Tax=Vibrio aerogenes CECT 7868 TaxID=1216006 RepID=A0A1M5Y6D8_9VIBR|nr:phage tail protein [Vibrio aerogenes]SHI07053.1 T4-like virus tail tube protein gp19 [Vibrio aerogenes CECT 7868]